MSLEDYEPVQSRFARFIEWCKQNDKQPQVISQLLSTAGADICVFRTAIYLGEVLVSTGHAEEIRDTSGKRSVNATSHTENAETSSLGRALANFPYANFAGTDFVKRPSREEMQKVQRHSESSELPQRTPVGGNARLATDKQKGMIKAISRSLGKTPPVTLDEMTMQDASEHITFLKELQEQAPQTEPF
jgi:hypothetical protein